MKTVTAINNKSLIERIWSNFGDFVFKQYSFFHTLLNHHNQLGNVYWSNAECYIRIGNSGYISKGMIYDINRDITAIKELIINSPEPVKIDLSETEFLKIKKLADEKHVSIKDILMQGIDKLQMTELQ